MRAHLAGTLAVLLAAACGGGGESAPGPLRFTLDDMHIAAVPVEEKKAVIDTKQGYDVAQMEKAQHEAQLADVQTKLDIAKNELEQTKLARKSAQAEEKAANASADLNRKNNAERDQHAAELGQRAAEAKMAFLKAKRAWLKRHIRFTEHNIYAAEARYHLEKAKVASAKNIRPSGFQLANFEKQARQRSEAMQRARLAADDEKKRAEGKRQDWNKKEQEYMTAKGIKGDPESSSAGLGTSTQTPTPTSTTTDNNQPLK